MDFAASSWLVARADETPSTGGNNQAPAMLAAVWPLVSLAGLFLWLRIYCKHRRRRGLWWDDYVLIASWVSLLISECIQTYRVSLGYGRPRDQIPAANMAKLAWLDNVATMFGIWAIAWSKTSFALSLLRIASQRWYRLVLIFITVSMNLFLNVGTVMIWIRPPSCQAIKNVKCEPDTRAVALNIASGAYSGLMDVVLAALPWVILRKVQMRKKEKIGVAVAMSMGLLGALADIFKCIEISKVSSPGIRQDGATPSLITWAAVESTVTIIGATIPVLRMLVIEISGSSAKRYASVSRPRARTLEAISSIVRSVGGRSGSATKSQPEHGDGSGSWDTKGVAQSSYELEADIQPPEGVRLSRRRDLEVGVLELRPKEGGDQDSATFSRH